MSLQALRHWEMLQHLTSELHSGTWPYAGDHPHLLGKQVSRLGFRELLDYVRYDPRFVVEGLEWRQPPCHWMTNQGTGHAALARFLDLNPMQLHNLLEGNLKAGTLRRVIHNHVARLRKQLGMEPLEYLAGRLHAHMQKLPSLRRPSWLNAAIPAY